jgi:hypothetical protein
MQFVPHRKQYISVLQPGTLTTRSQRRSTFFYITYINSVRTSQETQYISVLQPETLTTRPQRRSQIEYQWSRKYVSLDVSQPHWSQRPVTTDRCIFYVHLLFFYIPPPPVLWTLYFHCAGVYQDKVFYIPFMRSAIVTGCITMLLLFGSKSWQTSNEDRVVSISSCDHSRWRMGSWPHTKLTAQINTKHYNTNLCIGLG